jgi:hypothetical protein
MQYRSQAAYIGSVLNYSRERYVSARVMQVVTARVMRPS